MFSKSALILFLIQSALRYAECQADDDNPFFRVDYQYLKDTDSFYKVNTLLKTWYDAKVICEREGAMLFYPEDEDEAAEVIKYWNTTQPFMPEVYIGIADWNANDVFDTVDGRPISDVYNNWAYGEPNNINGKEGCVVIHMDKTLYDKNCNKRRPFICKKSQATLDGWNRECDLPDQSYEFSETQERCYKFHLEPKSWSEAYAICHAEQSYLAVINSKQEADHLVDITTQALKGKLKKRLSQAVHLGFKNMDGWITVKGVPLEESGYNEWSLDLNNVQLDTDVSKTCGSMVSNGKLKPIGCSKKTFFICEHEILSYSLNIINKAGMGNLDDY